ncbi:dihydrofolate reductase family protein [Cellulosimicrobium protaetiae]
MGHVVVANFISIDGVIQSPLSATEDPEGGFRHGGWVSEGSDDTVDAFMRDVTLGAAGMLLGRRTYDILRDAWADADESEPAVAAMNRMPKHVVSSSSRNLGWQGSRLLEGDLADAVRDLRERTDGTLVVLGSGTLVSSLAEHDLVDEYRLLVFPVVLGGGKRMFGGRSALARFELVGSDTSPRGVMIVTYARAR